MRKLKYLALGSVLGILLSGCITGGDNNPPTNQITRPTLNILDKWTQLLIDPMDKDTTEKSIQIVDDSKLFDTSEVYEATAILHSNGFTDAYGQHLDVSATSTIYLRKVDHRPVYISSILNEYLIQAGTSDTVKFTMKKKQVIRIIGSEPATLKPGMTWQTTETTSDTTNLYFDDTLFMVSDSTETLVYSDTAKSIGNITVKAGKFRAMEIAYTATKAGETAVSYSGRKYYSSTAKINVKVEEWGKDGVVYSRMELKSIP